MNLARVIKAVAGQVWPVWRKAKTTNASTAVTSLNTREARDFAAALIPVYDLLNTTPGTNDDAPLLAELAGVEQFIKSELHLLKCLLYKNKNQVRVSLLLSAQIAQRGPTSFSWAQHAHAQYWRHLEHVNKIMARLVDMRVARMHEFMPFTAPRPTPAGQPPSAPSKSANRSSGATIPVPQPASGLIAPPTKAEIEGVLYWLVAVASFVNQVGALRDGARPTVARRRTAHLVCALTHRRCTCWRRRRSTRWRCWRTRSSCRSR